MATHLRAGESFPVDIPTTGSWDNATNVSFLNDKPAGRTGFVHLRDGHFADGAGKRIRFLGGGMIRSACFPPHDQGEQLAARLAMQGFNLVRVHHIDTSHAPKGFWDPAYKDRHHLDPGQLERFDYLFDQLRRHGVYTNINLHVSRTFREADGIPEAKKLPRMGKAVTMFIPRMIELQKKYARDLLTHTNPYTGKCYVDDPALAMVEINNENSLVGYILGNKLPRLPAVHEQVLTGYWNRWLAARCRTTAAVRTRWGSIRIPLGKEILQNGDFDEGERNWTLEGQGHMQVEKTSDGPGGKTALRIRCLKPGKVSWTMQMHQIHLDLADGEPHTVSFWIRSAKPNTKVSVVARLDHAHPETGRYNVIGLNQTLAITRKWTRHQFTFRTKGVAPKGNRIGFTFPNEKGEFWLAGVSLRAGGNLGGPAEGRTLETRNIPRPLKNACTTAEWRDWIACATEIETAYFQNMRTFLKKELGVKCLVIGSQVSYGNLYGLLRESEMDYGDMHAYWQHPRFPGKPWDGKNWRVENTPLSAAKDGGTLLRLARHRIAGKPYIISEYNHPHPSDYAAECWPMIASFGALQDWDGVIIHNYVNYTSEDWEERRWNHYFDTSTSPDKAVFLPAAAIAFRTGAVAALASERVLQIPRDSVIPRLALGEDRLKSLWQPHLPDAMDALKQRLACRIVEGDGDVTMTSGKAEFIPPQIRWQATGPRNRYTVRTDQLVVATGKLANGMFTIGKATLNVGTTSTGCATIALVALDGRSLDQSEHLLLSAVVRAGNAGQTWKRDVKMLSSWGGNPAVAEAPPLELILERRKGARALAVYALDGRGNRTKSLPSTEEPGKLRVTTPGTQPALWYELSAE